MWKRDIFGSIHRKTVGSLLSCRHHFRGFPWIPKLWRVYFHGKSQSKMDKWFVYNGKSYKHGWELGVARWLRKPPYTGISKSWHEQIPVIVSLWRREARCKGSYRRVGFNYTNLFPDIQISGHISIFCWLHPRSQLIDHVTSLVNIWTLMAYTGPWTKTDTCLRTHGD